MAIVFQQFSEVIDLKFLYCQHNCWFCFDTSLRTFWLSLNLLQSFLIKSTVQTTRHHAYNYEKDIAIAGIWDLFINTQFPGNISLFLVDISKLGNTWQTSLIHWDCQSAFRSKYLWYVQGISMEFMARLEFRLPSNGASFQRVARTPL